ncbi:hypothetical protein OESDEN_21903 [Oesophagostomum dentatum]|uniref:Uncharacterized protein n=1 Tax=Oesophagostomum dentatum TaxID=61180 RepID=A0A0B1S3K8_OESDE|nr:hypothetical protein OESDEN_21903 [Oesophagostomum dentatum]
MGLTQNDLLVLIEKQRQTIERQRENLLNTELTLPSEADRELLQLQRQQENLRNILTPMRESNWPQQYQQQLKKSHKLRAAIEATKEAIDKTLRQVSMPFCFRLFHISRCHFALFTSSCHIVQVDNF